MESISNAETLEALIVGDQGRNHVFKVGGPIPWSRLLYRTKYGWYTQFVHCSLQLRKKLGWSIQILGVWTP